MRISDWSSDVCSSDLYLKSDIAISQELQRISSYLEPLAEPSCPSPACENHAEGVISSPGAYYTDGKTPTGSQRWKCRSCGSRFSAKAPTVGQKKHHENELVFKPMVNKNSIRSITRVADLSPDRKSTRLNPSHY